MSYKKDPFADEEFDAEFDDDYDGEYSSSEFGMVEFLEWNEKESE